MDYSKPVTTYRYRIKLSGKDSERDKEGNFIIYYKDSKIIAELPEIEITTLDKITKIELLDIFKGTKGIQTITGSFKKHMTKYIGVKEVTAGIDYNDVRGEGYIVIYEDGYESWSPKEVFEKAYKEKLSIEDINIDKSKLLSWQWNVYRQALDLRSEINKLKEFLNNTNLIKTSSAHDKILMEQQLLAMEYQLTILVERINNFKL